MNSVYDPNARTASSVVFPGNMTLCLSGQYCLWNKQLPAQNCSGVNSGGNPTYFCSQCQDPNYQNTCYSDDTYPTDQATCSLGMCISTYNTFGLNASECAAQQ